MISTRHVAIHALTICFSANVEQLFFHGKMQKLGVSMKQATIYLMLFLSIEKGWYVLFLTQTNMQIILEIVEYYCE